MDSKCFFALCCILLVSFPTGISAIRPKTTMSKMADGLHLATQIKKLPSYRALSIQKKIDYGPVYPATPIPGFSPDPKGPHNR
uniref:Uncharacterized protein n=1 Tax=Tanacetum cinerariifolium TaxID=118510 RepID=A0A699GUN5_TANCI|nr:hypothetical protein [Tanacetum cinerariifolium]